MKQKHFFPSLVKSLRNSLKEKKGLVDLCKKESNVLRQCVLCKYYLSSNRWSRVIEDSLKKRYGITSGVPGAKGASGGDGFIQRKGSGLTEGVEIKVSLGDDTGRFNFVQIRPGDKTVAWYLFLGYNVNEPKTKLGRVYYFLFKSDELYSLLPQYGNYAHGSKRTNGEITALNVKTRSQMEYALRPKIDKNNDLFKEFLRHHRTEGEIKNILR